MAEDFKDEVKTKKPRIQVMSPLDFEIPWGFFDGACQGHPPVCEWGFSFI
jgi:hypothetical protein